MHTRSTSDAATPSERLANVQALRGVAALLVLAMHATVRQVRYFGADGATIRAAAHVARSIGHLGVDLFFVISGFIICTVVARASRGAVGGTARLRVTGRFAWRRALRIYPLYWLVCAVMAALVAMLPRPATPAYSAPLLAQLLLLTRSVDLLSVAWTLAFEMYFYAVVAGCLLVFGSRAVLGIALWIAAEMIIIVHWTLAPDADSWLAPWSGSLVFDPMVLEFGLGCAVAALVPREARLPARLVLVSALVPIAIGATALYGRLTTSMQVDDPWLRLRWFGIGAALLLTGAVLAERRGERLAPRWLQAVGDASYSLYLWHVPVIVALGELGRRLPFGWTKGGGVMAVLDAAVAVVVALLSYRWLERPLLERGRTTRVAAIAPARAA